MEWIKPKDQPPPQGKKILYFKDGDIYVVQRFADLWLPIPFFDSQYSFTEEPDLWADFTPPDGYTGKLHVQPGEDGIKYDIDQCQKLFPEVYDLLVKVQRSNWTQKTPNLSKNK
jgi:hypothetical protein